MKAIKIDDKISAPMWIAIMITAFIAKDYILGIGEVILVIIIAGSTYYLGQQILLNKFSQRISGELVIINTICLLFMIPSLYRCFNLIKSLMFVLSFFVCILYIWLLLLVKWRKNWILLSASYFTQNIYLLFGIVFAILLRIPQFGTIPKWDAQIYSYCLSDACINFDYTCDKFFRYFSTASHTSWGYTFLSSIVEFWRPFSNYTLSILGMILTILTFAAVYEVLKSMGNMSSFFAMLSAIVVTTTPIFSGTYTYYTLDFGVASLFFILVFFWIKKFELLTLLFSVLFCLTKEPVGIIFVAGLLIYNILKCFSKNRNIKNFFYALFHEPSNYSFAVSILLCLAGFIKISINSKQATWGLVQQEGKTINYFDWNPNFMHIKSVQIMFINFAWLSIFLIFVLCVIVLVKKIRLNCEILSVLIGMIFYIIFSLLYYTYAIPRYNIIIYMIINFIACYLICVVIQNVQLRSTLMILLSLLFSIQTYFNVDFIMLNTFPVVSTGKYALCNTSIDQDYLGDYIVYNYMYSYFDSVILTILEDAEYTGQEDIFVMGTDGDSFVGGSKILAPIYFDKLKEKWSLLPNSNTLYVKSRDEGIWDDPEAALSDKALVIMIPYYKFDLYEQKAKMEAQYEIRDQRTVETFYGNAEYWVLNRRN